MRSLLFSSVLVFCEAATVLEFFMWPETDGSYSVEADASMCRNSSSQRFPMTVQLFDTSIINGRYASCEIEITALEERRLRLGEGTRFFSSIANRSFLGIGPGSQLATDRGIDIITTGGNSLGTVMKIGTSDTQFADTCFPGTFFRIPTASIYSVNSVTARFNLVNVTTSELSYRSFNELVELKSIPGPSGVAIFPRSLALRLEGMLLAHGAVRIPASEQEIWSYTNCTLSIIPYLAIDFFSAPGRDSSVVGSVLLFPADFMPECEFRVSPDGTSNSLDIFKLPNINKRIGANEIALCDSRIRT